MGGDTSRRPQRRRRQLRSIGGSAIGGRRRGDPGGSAWSVSV